ncbi:MAG: hypothetical protein Q8P76_03710, partial [bacterium]|nr:hypothetical protein [bacterium]
EGFAPYYNKDKELSLRTKFLIYGVSFYNQTSNKLISSLRVPQAIFVVVTGFATAIKTPYTTH